MEKPVKSGGGFSAEEREKAANAIREKSHQRALEAARHDDPVQWLIDNPGNSKVANASHCTAASQWSKYLSKFPDVKQAWEERKKNAAAHVKPVEAVKDDFEEVVIKLKGKFGIYSIAGDGWFYSDTGDADYHSGFSADPQRAVPVL